MQGGGAHRLFGTDGIRGIAGDYPLDDITIELFGLALVSNLARELGRAPRIIIGRDTRESGPRIQSALSRAAASAGAEVESAGVITTPGIAYITRATPFDAGVVISASHNPYLDNGIKVFSPSGKKLADEMERRIEADIQAGNAAKREVFENTIPALDLGAFQDREAEYHHQYLAYLENEVGRALNLEGLSIGLDCANGAASEFAPILFQRLGASLEVISNSPDGRNINEACGSLHLEGLQRLVVENRLDLGIAFDGDADRALFVDSAGNLVDGDATLLDGRP